MTIDHLTLPASLSERITATRTFRAVQALIGADSDPIDVRAEIARLTEDANASMHAADWLTEKGFCSYAKPCALQALAAACGADLLARTLTTTVGAA